MCASALVEDFVGASPSSSAGSAAWLRGRSRLMPHALVRARAPQDLVRELGRQPGALVARGRLARPGVGSDPAQPRERCPRVSLSVCPCVRLYMLRPGCSCSCCGPKPFGVFRTVRKKRPARPARALHGSEAWFYPTNVWNSQTRRRCWLRISLRR